MNIDKLNNISEDLITYANVPVIIWDSKFRIIRLNTAFEDLTGLKFKDLKGKSVETLFPASQVSASMKHIEKTLIGQRWKLVEIDILHRDGTSRTLLWNSSTIFNSDEKKPAATIAQGRDITKRKKTETKLKQSNWWLNNILTSTKTSLDIIDSGFNIVYLDNGWEEIYGDYKGRKCYEYFMNRKSMCPACGIQKALKTKKPVITENVSLPREKNRPIQIITLPFQNEKNEWLVAEVKMDISERKKMEKEKEAACQQLRTTVDEVKKEKNFNEIITETTQVIILVLNENGKIVTFNPYMEKISGYKLKEVKGKDWFTTFLPKCDYTIIKKIFKKSLKNTPASGSINPILTKTGKELLIKWYDKILKDSDGNILGIICVGHDITEQRKTETVIQNSLLKLEEQKKLLTEKNIAFKELIKTIALDKNDIEHNVMVNVDKIIIPLVKKLKLQGASGNRVDLIIDHLNTLTSSFGQKITNKTLNLSPREIEICDLIKNGNTTKEIAALLSISPLTIDKQRSNIRHKLGLSNKNTNLTTYLWNL